MPQDLTTFFAEFHAWIDQHVAAESPVQQVKPCPACSAPCHLKWGRHTQAWRWSHERPSDCPLAKAGKVMLYQTYPEALAGALFKES